MGGIGRPTRVTIPNRMRMTSLSSSYAIGMCKSSYSKYPIAVCGMGKIDGSIFGAESKYLMEVQLQESASGKGCYDMVSTKKTNLSDGQQKRQLQRRLGR